MKLAVNTANLKYSFRGYWQFSITILRQAKHFFKVYVKTQIVWWDNTVEIIDYITPVGRMDVSEVFSEF